MDFSLEQKKHHKTYSTWKKVGISSGKMMFFFSEEKPWFHQERWGMNRQTSSVFLRNMPTKGFHHDNYWLKPGISGVAVDGTSINHHESQVCCDTPGLLKVNRPIPILEGTHHFTAKQDVLKNHHASNATVPALHDPTLARSWLGSRMLNYYFVVHLCQPGNANCEGLMLNLLFPDLG